MSMTVDNKKAIIDYLSSVPKALCIEDIGDLFYLVEQHYVSRTPHTIKVCIGLSHISGNGFKSILFHLKRNYLFVPIVR